jgi:hypothetical protein
VRLFTHVAETDEYDARLLLLPARAGLDVSFGAILCRPVRGARKEII